ncbi:MAG: arsenate reductase (glutaredoxin) [Bacteroidia bacterium]
MKSIKVKKENKKNIEISSSKEKSQEKYTIYHNNRCSKSREACSILQEKGIAFETIEYLKTPLNQKQLKELLLMLGITAEALVRKSEPIYKELFANKKLTNAQWIKALAENPVLIERPIIVKGNKAVIGRPIEKVVGFID